MAGLFIEVSSKVLRIHLRPMLVFFGGHGGGREESNCVAVAIIVVCRFTAQRHACTARLSAGGTSCISVYEAVKCYQLLWRYSSSAVQKASLARTQ